MLTIHLLLACGGDPVVPILSPDDRLRIAVETAPVTAVPSCGLLDGCPQQGLSPSACVDDPALFTVSMFGDTIASVELDPQTSGSLAEGEWFAPFPDPLGGCALTIFTFRVGE